MCHLDGLQPLDTKPPSRYCFVVEVTVPWSLFAVFGGVLCLYILESLLPLDFSGLLEPMPTHRKQDVLLRAM